MTKVLALEALLGHILGIKRTGKRVRIFLRIDLSVLLTRTKFVVPPMYTSSQKQQSGPPPDSAGQAIYGHTSSMPYGC